MSSFFDAASREVREAGQQVSDETFLAELEGIERGVIFRIYGVIGDREFPEEMREKIMGTIAVESVGGLNSVEVPNERAREMACMTRSSRVIESLHSLFHDVARARIQTRFGLLSDSPPDILARRKEHDTEPTS